MRFALIYPQWTFEESIYSGCREPHLPLEYGYAKMLLEERGHDVLLLNGPLDRLSNEEILNQLESFKPAIAVLATANSYLFRHCTQPELKIPVMMAEDLRQVANLVIAVGPHGTSTPRATLRKLKVDAVVLGECEEVLPLFADSMNDFQFIPSIAYRAANGEVRIQGTSHSSNMTLLPPLKWENATLRKHSHHHRRFNAEPLGPGAEMEISRGCPYHCSFCARDTFRNQYRKRPNDKILDELDSLLNHGVEYIYFIDEIFLPDRNLLESFSQRKFVYGIQTRMDLWDEELIELLGKSGCVFMEADVESITEDGRAQFDKNDRLTTHQLKQKLFVARQNIPCVQATLLETPMDDEEALEEWREYLKDHGVWVNEPVLLFPYPGSSEYARLWGIPDDYAWERAQNYYLKRLNLSHDIQEQEPDPVHELEMLPV